MSLEASFLRLAPPERWVLGDRTSLGIWEALDTRLEVEIREEDLRRALNPYPCENYRLRVDLRPGTVVLEVRFHPLPPPWAGLAEVVARPRIREGGQVWMEEPRILLNGQDCTEVFRGEFEKIQPFADLRDFGLSARLDRVEVGEDRLVLSTLRPPGLAEGPVYRYVRGAEPPGPSRAEILGGSLEGLRDGDILFVNGKAWRTKLVRLAEKSPPGFSHAGILRFQEGVPRVIHASPEEGRVVAQSLEGFLAFENVDALRVYRLREGDRGEGASRKALAYALRDVPFDDRFDSTDEGALYCTEVIWRAYEDVGVDLGAGGWVELRNPVIRGKVLLPYGLSRSPLLTEVFAFP